MRKRALMGVTAALVLAALALAQAPAGKSQSAAAGGAGQSSVTLDGKSIAVQYAPMSKNGRQVFGGVVPYNKVWCVGDKSAAVLRAGADLAFPGVVVPKGDYSLYVLPAPDKWQLIINKQTGAKALTYDSKLDIGRLPMKLAKSPAPVETLRVTLTKTAAMAARLEVAFDGAVATVPVRLDRIVADPEW